MARISILELPTQSVGEVYHTPFVLVIDQVESQGLETYSGDTIVKVDELNQAQADAWAEQAGAVAALLTNATLDIA